jgi:CHAD domain
MPPTDVGCAGDYYRSRPASHLGRRAAESPRDVGLGASRRANDQFLGFAWQHETRACSLTDLLFTDMGIFSDSIVKREQETHRHIQPLPTHAYFGILCFDCHAHQNKIDVAPPAKLFERVDENRSVRRHKHDAHWHTMLARIHACLASDQLLAVPRTASDFASELRKFDKDRRKQFKPIAKKRIMTWQLHALRSEGKRIRYVGEALNDLTDQDLSSALKSLCQLQNLPGDLHDVLQV